MAHIGRDGASCSDLRLRARASSTDVEGPAGPSRPGVRWGGGVRGRGVSPRPPLLCGPVGGRAAPCGLLIAETPGWRRGAGSAPAAAPRVCVRLALRGEPLPVEVVYRLLVSVIDVL